jgi:hypothetical protein
MSKKSSSKAGIVLVCFIVALIVVGTWLAWGKHKHALVIAGAEQEVKAAEAKRAEFDRDTEKFNDLAQRVSDSMQLLTRSPRMSLAGPMANMQTLRRELSKAEFHSCMGAARDKLAEATDAFYNDMLAFMSDTKYGDDSAKIVAMLDDSKKAKIDCDAKTAGPVESAKRSLAALTGK